MGIEEVFIDPCPGCENVVPGIVAPGGSPSPPLTSGGGASGKKYEIQSLIAVYGPITPFAESLS